MKPSFELPSQNLFINFLIIKMRGRPFGTEGLKSCVWQRKPPVLHRRNDHLARKNDRFSPTTFEWKLITEELLVSVGRLFQLADSSSIVCNPHDYCSEVGISSSMCFYQNIDAAHIAADDVISPAAKNLASINSN
jgi:hypothetical protein